jgi:hypothetical protein
MGSETGRRDGGEMLEVVHKRIQDYSVANLHQSKS